MPAYISESRVVCKCVNEQVGVVINSKQWRLSVLILNTCASNGYWGEGLTVRKAEQSCRNVSLLKVLP